MLRALRPVAESLLLAAFAAVVAGFAFRYLPFLSVAEQWLEDYRIGTLSRAQDKSEDIVVVGITEDTLARFKYRSPVNRAFIANLLDTLADKGVRAVGLDVLLDQPTDPEKDKRVYEAIRTFPEPLAITYATESDGLTEDQAAFMNKVVPPEKRGLGNLLTDGMRDTVRWIYPGREGPSGRWIPGLAARLSQHLGGPVPRERQPMAWRPRPAPDKHAFKVYPAHAVKALPDAWFKDRIVLIGAVQPQTDRHRTPFSTVQAGREGMLPGIIIHAHALWQLLNEHPPPKPGPWVHWGVVALLALVGAGLTFVGQGLPVRLAGAGVVAVGFLAGGFALYRWTGVLIPLGAPALALFGALWLADIRLARRERHQRRFLKDAFSRYMAPSRVEQLLDDPSQLALVGERRELTFLFTDIAGFTTLSEQVDPAELTGVLNRYFEGVCQEVEAAGGTIIDFIGDAVFVIFGAPLPEADHAARAVECAARIDRFCEEFRHTDPGARALDLGETRVGLHTGVAMVGNFGSSSRFAYTALGDAVNTASRVEGLNKAFSTRICFTDAVLHHMAPPDPPPARPLGDVAVKGRGETVTVHEYLPPERAADPFWVEYRRAYALMAHGSPEALPALRALAEQGPDDPTLNHHIERLEAGARDATIVMTEK